MIIPDFLQPKDQIRIITPSGKIQPELIDGAAQSLSNWGYQVTTGKNAYNQYGRFGGTRTERIADLQDAINSPEVKCILCSRGGYGLSQIIDQIDFTALREHPKWIIGFSDITVLHNALAKNGIASIHAIMAKHLCELNNNDHPKQMLKEILEGKLPDIRFREEPENRPGEAHGKLIGGNLSVFSALMGTEFEPDFNNNILFLEDIAEEAYHIDRMMNNLRLSGKLAQLSGMLIGQFSDCNEDESMKQSIRELLLEAVSEYQFPVYFNFPSGHVDYNLPLVLGTKVSLKTSNSEVLLMYDKF